MRKHLLTLGIATVVASQAFLVAPEASASAVMQQMLAAQQVVVQATVATKTNSAGNNAVLLSSRGGQVAEGQLAALSRPTRGTVPTLSVEGRTGNGLHFSGDPSNSVLLLDIGIGNELVGVGWEVSLDAASPSWLSEASVTFASQANSEDWIRLRPGIADSLSGSGTYSSEGVVLFADASLPNVPTNNGELYIEWSETFDDSGVDPDSTWHDPATGVTLPPGLRLVCADQAACDAALGGSEPPGDDDLEVTLTLAPNTGDPEECGAETALVANVGDQINFCYTVTNQSTETLEYHSLDDSVFGSLLHQEPITLAPGDSYSYVEVVTASESGTHVGTWTGATALPGYSFDDSATYVYTDISTTGQDLALTDDSEANVTLPFPVTLFGTSSDQLRVGNNGAALFGVDTGDVGFSNTALPSTQTAAAFMPFWDDFDDESGGVWYEVLGTEPERVAVIQWRRPHYNGATNPDEGEFQLLLGEDGSIVFNYVDVEFGNAEWDFGLSATLGVQDAGGATALYSQYSFNEAVLSNGQAIEVILNEPVSFTGVSNSVTLDVGSPVITVDPEEIVVAADVGGSVTETITIGNTGTRDLEWNADEAPAGVVDPRAHFPAFERPLPSRGFDSNASALAETAPAEVLAKLAQQGQRVYDPASRSSYFGSGRGTGTVPAYTNTGYSHTDYVTLDALVPGTLTSIVDPQVGTIYAATFLDNDFTRQFFIAGTPSTGATLALGAYGYIDTATGAATQLGVVTTPSGYSWTSAAQDPTTGIVYAAASAAAGSNQLYTVDPVTGAATLVGTLSGAPAAGALLVGIAISPEGLMYGLDIAADVLIAIDKSTAEAAVIGPLGLNANFAQDIDFDQSTGVLYWPAYMGSGNTQMSTIDPATGETTAIGPIQDGAELLSFSIAVAGGNCSSASDVPWLSLSPTSGMIAVGDPEQEVTVTLDAATLTDGLYEASVCVRSNDPNRAVVEVPVSFTVGEGGGGSEADLGLSLFGVPSTVDAGGSVSLGAIVANFGPAAAEDVAVVLELPEEFTFVSGRLIQGGGNWTCSDASGTVTCELVSGSLPIGEVSAALQIEIDVASDAVAGTVETIGEVSGSTTDPNPANDTSSVETTINEGEGPTEDAIFCDGFEEGGNGSCSSDNGGGGEPGFYTDRDEFLANVQAGYYEEDFADVPVGDAGPSLSFSGSGFAYTVTAVGDGTNNLYNDPGLISTDSALDALVITFTGDPVTAIGGNFWATDINFAATGGDIVLTLDDGTTETYPSAATGFAGFVTESPIVSITIDAPDTLENNWSALDNVIVGIR